MSTSVGTKLDLTSRHDRLNVGSDGPALHRQQRKRRSQQDREYHPRYHESRDAGHDRREHENVCERESQPRKIAEQTTPTRFPAGLPGGLDSLSDRQHHVMPKGRPQCHRQCHRGVLPGARRVNVNARRPGGYDDGERHGYLHDRRGTEEQAAGAAPHLPGSA